ncbi:MAG: hypothetical protein AMXMBFR34_36120 [Myxococcaceae bacterium]
MARSTRSTGRRASATTRQHPRFALDVDWFVESEGASAMGRGLEISVRTAKLPLTCTSPFAGDVTLHLALPLRERMFKVRCRAVNFGERGWCLGFLEVTPEDLQLLGHTLLVEFGPAALPNLERRPAQDVVLGQGE